MKKFIQQALLALVIFAFTLNTGVAAQLENNSVNVQVHGLVCDFCARALEKVFGKRDEVQNINVDLNNGNILIQFNEGQTIHNAELTSLITDSGYKVIGIERGDNSRQGGSNE